jgi:hypothetical protein
MFGFENRGRYAAEDVARGRATCNKVGGETERREASHLTQKLMDGLRKGLPSLA